MDAWNTYPPRNCIGVSTRWVAPFFARPSESVGDTPIEQGADAVSSHEVETSSTGMRNAKFAAPVRDR